jgi:hypothetical protein
MPAEHIPECVSIVVCDSVIEDIRTRNKTLVGLFNGITAPSAPATHARMFIMVALTDGRGEQDIVVGVDSPSGQRIFEGGVKIKFDNPLVVHDLVLELQQMVLPEFGEYYVGVYVGKKRIASRRFSLLKVKPNANNN